MPFTFSHPAIILPLLGNRRYFSFTALVAGSMAPDFEYFIHMKMMQVHGHTIPGMIYYDLPLALLLCFVFHLFVRDALLRYSPLRLKPSFTPFKAFNWPKHFKEKWLVIITSAFIGICSHLFWDAFTHANSTFVNLIPFLQDSSAILGIKAENHAHAQIISSLVGLASLFFVFINYKDPFQPKKSYFMIGIFWSLVAIIAVIVLILRNVQSLSDLIATAIAAVLIGLILAPGWMNYLHVREPLLHKE